MGLPEPGHSLSCCIEIFLNILCSSPLFVCKAGTPNSLTEKQPWMVGNCHWRLWKAPGSPASPALFHVQRETFAPTVLLSCSAIFGKQEETPPSQQQQPSTMRANRLVSLLPLLSWMMIWTCQELGLISWESMVEAQVAVHLFVTPVALLPFIYTLVSFFDAYGGYGGPLQRSCDQPVNSL